MLASSRLLAKHHLDAAWVIRYRLTDFHRQCAKVTSCRLSVSSNAQLWCVVCNRFDSHTILVSNPWAAQEGLTRDHGSNGETAAYSQIQLVNVASCVIRLQGLIRDLIMNYDRYSESESLRTLRRSSDRSTFTPYGVQLAPADLRIAAVSGAFELLS